MKCILREREKRRYEKQIGGKKIEWRWTVTKKQGQDYGHYTKRQDNVGGRDEVYIKRKKKEEI